ncbi:MULTISPECIES: SAM-dependent methyltransferase [unclassified Polaromonas]|jgi:16S rRNA (cytidine1402-2'-O)-methyltransferase|uniref:SAM-dependent methyltransferase n=1 Tax=unclassified Polaromonas TaxID=2638319 RepID=UPI000BD109AF|nr:MULTISPECIES: SAM-dependent methyltransferase [unclassified Polaromonas]OYY36533.1 MAG: ribosomal RNA small subunit methyltransferase I [Polaromonas sp. 35-63-35]OYZ22769.1 MAG: ribosomal RNA small subunit methyltransferase I [Polaromonas sp. 16-63-31]OYZ81019.1 MAG: ribosomal RNA small subunit methyltransferase I [Polaromonas sp. 24-63-21]OZA52763.1 MAG: ribosomal RNA small subunit methyltransferase I [Polaromonas sp. 17-63-33]OZA88384.1 MAG: ribosomal RNA small subunit methyltransferase I
MTGTAKGRLYLVPAPLDFGCDVQAPLQDVMPLGTLQIAATLSCWICENAKSTRAYLKRVGEVVPLQQPVQAQQIQELPREVHKKGDHGGNFDARPLLAAALVGRDIGLVSEAGMPAIADPGSSVVRAAHELGLQVLPLVGPMSLVLALAASGLNGQNFAFVGYLPQDGGERSQRIRELESLALKTGQTQIFIETPYRNTALLQALLQTLQHNTRLALSCGLSLPGGWSRSASVSTWKRDKPAAPLALPTVFCIGR